MLYLSKIIYSALCFVAITTAVLMFLYLQTFPVLLISLVIMWDIIESGIPVNNEYINVYYILCVPLPVQYHFLCVLLPVQYRSILTLITRFVDLNHTSIVHSQNSCSNVFPLLSSGNYEPVEDLVTWKYFRNRNLETLPRS